MEGIARRMLMHLAGCESAQLLALIRYFEGVEVLRVLTRLRERNLARRMNDDRWHITDEGRRRLLEQLSMEEPTVSQLVRAVETFDGEHVYSSFVRARNEHGEVFATLLVAAHLHFARGEEDLAEALSSYGIP